MRTSALLALEDGTVYHGESLGAIGTSVGVVVFTPYMADNQENLEETYELNQTAT